LAAKKGKKYKFLFLRLLRTVQWLTYMYVFMLMFMQIRQFVVRDRFERATCWCREYITAKVKGKSALICPNQAQQQAMLAE
jgi:ribosome modulation factor